MPPATGVGQADKMEAKHGGHQNAQPANGATISQGFWGAPPGLTPPSEVSQSAKRPPSQEAANKAERDAQQALLEYQAAKDALAAMEPNDPAGTAAKENWPRLHSEGDFFGDTRST